MKGEDDSVSRLKFPNWSELHSFVNFLDDQLEVLERTEFLKLIPEFKCIFVNLVIMMAYDFGLPSLNIGEESSAFNITDNNQVIKILNWSFGVFVMKNKLVKKNEFQDKGYN